MYLSLYRHSEDMIKKLENAGLGFYVRETETHQKLGILFSCMHIRIKQLAIGYLFSTCRQDPSATVGVSCVRPPSQYATTGV